MLYVNAVVKRKVGVSEWNVGMSVRRRLSMYRASCAFIQHTYGSIMCCRIIFYVCTKIARQTDGGGSYRTTKSHGEANHSSSSDCVRKFFKADNNACYRTCISSS